MAEIREQLQRADQGGKEKQEDAAFQVPVEQLSLGDEAFYEFPPVTILEKGMPPEPLRLNKLMKQPRGSKKPCFLLGVAAKVVNVDARSYSN